MALARRRRGFEAVIWPGFVDALASLLLVVIFVLMVFFLIQVNQALRISGQDQAITQLRSEIAALAEMLNLEQRKLTDAVAENKRLAIIIADSDAKIKTLTADIAALQDRLAAENARAGRAEEQTRASRREVLALTRALDALRDRISRLQTLLDEKEAEALAAKEASANLSRRLNEALTSKIVQLQAFRSEFFGVLREILKDRADIRIVGDRFVFDSEVLFEQGSDEIGPEGRATLIALAGALDEIARRIPTEIDWVLQVSGHTDSRPINTERFPDNWALSAARATAVVRFMIEHGTPPERLSAAGFGEFRPADTGRGEAANARNRRIEFQLTQR